MPQRWRALLVVAAVAALRHVVASQHVAHADGLAVVVVGLAAAAESQWPGELVGVLIVRSHERS